MSLETRRIKPPMSRGKDIPKAEPTNNKKRKEKKSKKRWKLEPKGEVKPIKPTKDHNIAHSLEDIVKSRKYWTVEILRKCIQSDAKPAFYKLFEKHVRYSFNQGTGQLDRV